MRADDTALRRFVTKFFPPGTDIYSPKVMKKLTEELLKASTATSAATDEAVAK